MQPQVEIVDIETPIQKIVRLLKTARIVPAIGLDLVDLILGHFPIVNTLWDMVTYFVLRKTLKNKNLAHISLTELLLPGMPMLGQIDAIIPLATITTLVDMWMDVYTVENGKVVKRIK